MKRITLSVALICLLAASTAMAGNPMGIRGGISSSPDQFFVGAQMYVTELSPNLWLVPKVDAGFGDDMTFIYAFGTVLYNFVTSDMGGFTPYAGGGAGITFWSFDDSIIYPAGYTGPKADTSGSDFGITGIAGLKKTMESGKELGFELEVGLSDYTADFKAAAYINFF